MSEKGRLEFWDSGTWFLSAFGGDLDGFVRAWLISDDLLESSRWVEGDAVVYLPRCE